MKNPAHMITFLFGDWRAMLFLPLLLGSASPNMPFLLLLKNFYSIDKKTKKGEKTRQHDIKFYISLEWYQCFHFLQAMAVVEIPFFGTTHPRDAAAIAENLLEMRLMSILEMRLQ